MSALPPRADVRRARRKSPLCAISRRTSKLGKSSLEPGSWQLVLVQPCHLARATSSSGSAILRPWRSPSLRSRWISALSAASRRRVAGAPLLTVCGWRMSRPRLKKPKYRGSRASMDPRRSEKTRTRMEPKKIGRRSKNFSRNSRPSRPMLSSWPYFAGSSLILSPPFETGMTQSGVATSAELRSDI